MQTVAFCEIDLFCRRVLAKHWPSAMPRRHANYYRAKPTLMLSAEASHVRISVSRGRRRTCRRSFGTLPGTHSSHSRGTTALHNRGERGSAAWSRAGNVFSETWPRSGMTRNGIAFRRAPLVHSTTEIEFGLLPILEASNTKAIALRSAGRSPRNWLKPLPTLTKRDWRSGKGKTQTERGRTTGPSMAEVANGPLNPTWCEWFMGFPRGWTELPLSAMPSSRKSRKS